MLFFVARSLFWNVRSKPETAENTPATSSTKEVQPTPTPPANPPTVASPAVVAKTPENPKIAPTSYVPPSLIVSQSGQGDYTSIAEAIKNAKSGDTITVKPGIYREPRLVISKPLRIVGDGPADSIIVENPDGDTCMALDANLIYLKGLTLRGAKYTSNVIYVYKGDPTIDECAIDASSGSRLGCIGIYVNGDETAAPTIRSCKVTGGRDSGIRFDNGRGMLVFGCEISGNQFGILLSKSGSGYQLMNIRRSNITGNDIGIFANPGSQATVENCDLRGNSRRGLYAPAGAQIELTDSSQ